jgi:hypothetical protein
MVTVEDVRTVALRLPRTTEHLIRGRVKFRVQRLVYVAFSRDQTLMGFGFPKEERLALVGSEPEKFLLPPPRRTCATTGSTRRSRSSTSKR